jgi:hypothetical protein
MPDEAAILLVYHFWSPSKVADHEPGGACRDHGLRPARPVKRLYGVVVAILQVFVDL